MSGVPGLFARELQPGRARLQVRPPARQGLSRPQRQLRHRMHGLHQGPVLQGGLQVLSSPRPPPGSHFPPFLRGFFAAHTAAFPRRPRFVSPRALTKLCCRFCFWWSFGALKYFQGF